MPKTPPKPDAHPSPLESATGDREPGEEAGNASNNDTETNKKHEENQKEVGGRGGLDPTRFGDWEKAGRCIDF